MSATHYHSCPECYIHWPCDDKCTIEQDLQDGDKEFGAHTVCLLCRGQEPLPFEEEYSAEWFDKYNGVR
jgi:hypothetical protein